MWNLTGVPWKSLCPFDINIMMILHPQGYYEVITIVSLPVSSHDVGSCLTLKYRLWLCSEASQRYGFIWTMTICQWIVSDAHTSTRTFPLWWSTHTSLQRKTNTAGSDVCVCVCVCVCVIWMECIEAQTALRVSLPLKFNLCWTSKPELK